jgi:hypothetical protein
LPYEPFAKILPQTALRVKFELFLKSLPGYENIDQLPTPPKGMPRQKADAFFKGRRIILEYKELYEGRHPFFDPDIVRTKDKVDRLHLLTTATEQEVFSQLVAWHITPAEDRRIKRAFTKSMGNIERFVSKADKQTYDTKISFELPHSYGVLVILNSRINVILPHNIYERIHYLMGQADTETGQLNRFRENDAVIIIGQAHYPADGAVLTQTLSERLVAPNANEWPQAYINDRLRSLDMYTHARICLSMIVENARTTVRRFVRHFVRDWVSFCEHEAKKN